MGGGGDENSKLENNNNRTTGLPDACRIIRYDYFPVRKKKLTGGQVAPILPPCVVGLSRSFFQTWLPARTSNAINRREQPSEMPRHQTQRTSPRLTRQTISWFIYFIFGRKNKSWYPNYFSRSLISGTEWIITGGVTPTCLKRINLIDLNSVFFSSKMSFFFVFFLRFEHFFTNERQL